MSYFIVRYMTENSPGRVHTRPRSESNTADGAMAERDHHIERWRDVTHCWVEEVSKGRTLRRCGFVSQRIDGMVM
ncbi:hypothetical protein JQ608_06770 [Bradyrhizobium liaoningense]|uniref:hypothetical protein n=1 Tax=Bradyrhizobium liaoningense TaxID=43992 RepID=UPI001BA78112|nr:hypothetical protein [Bradyrhizobium liaoningense]MBR0876904.1 hypothetical protein [Bradyrhizobium liaoningense]